MQLLKVSGNNNIDGDYLQNVYLGKQDIVKLFPSAIKERCVEIFDTAYLSFISYRQQRDLFLASEFYKYFISNCKIQKKFFNDIDIVDNLITFDDKTNNVKIRNISVFDNVVRNNAKLLEETMIKIKSLNDMFLEFNIFANRKDSDVLKSIKAKINKVATIDDESFLKQMIGNKKLRQEIIDRLPKIIKFEKIKASRSKIDDVFNL